MDFRCGAVVAAFILACGTAAGATAAPAGTAQFQAEYDAQCTDLVSENWTALESTFSPNFVADNNGSTVSRADIISGLKMAATHGFKVTTCTSTVDSVTENSGVYIVLVRQTLDAMQGSKKYEIVSGRREMWTQANGQLAETSSLPLWRTVSVDGQIIQQTGTVPSPGPSATP